MAIRIIVGIGELAVSNDRDSVVVTHALGSCVAVCLWDEAAGVAGLAHVLLPDSRINPELAHSQPAAFVDTGIAMLLHEAVRHGASTRRCHVRLVGGADVVQLGQAEASVGLRNIEAARAMLGRSGVTLSGEAVGGTWPRTVAIAVATGQMTVSTAGEVVAEL